MKFLTRIFVAVLIGVAVWTCTESEPDKPDTLTLTLNDSLKASGLKYDSIKIDLYTVKGGDSTYAKTLFHGAYTDAAQLTNLNIGFLADGNFSVKLIGFRDGVKVLELRLEFSSGDPSPASVVAITPPDTPKVIITWPLLGHVTNQDSIEIQWGVDSANTGVVVRPSKVFHLDEGTMPLTLLDTNGRGIVGQATIQVTRVAGVLFVNAAALDSGDGNSWATAYRNVQTALARATDGWDLWVAKGTYRAFEGTGVDSLYDTSFAMKTGVDLFGGFAGTEGIRDLRNWAINETVLSGERGDTTIGDNAGPILLGANNATVDGFVVERGFTNAIERGSALENVMVSPFVLNCVFRWNQNHTPDQGATVWCNSSSAQFQNCRFLGNQSWHVAGVFHGGTGISSLLNSTFIENQSGNPGGTVEIGGLAAINISHCLFQGNSGSSGAAIANNSFPLNISNCIFIGNHSTALGGAVFSGRGGSVTNCVFSGNTAISGGAIYSFDTVNVLNSTFFENATTDRGAALYISAGNLISPSKVKNSIFWNNASIVGGTAMTIETGMLDISYSAGTTSYFDTLGGAMVNIGLGNVDGYPAFLNSAVPSGTDGMFFTQDDGLSTYLGISKDAGDPDSTGLPSTDILGSPRIGGGRVDIGAYEQ